MPSAAGRRLPPTPRHESDIPSAETPLVGKGGLTGALAHAWPGWRNTLDARQRGGASPMPLSPLAHVARSGQGRDAGAAAAGAPSSPPPSFTFVDFVSLELGWGWALAWQRPARAASESVANFLSVPLRFEAFASLSHALCADLFLFHFTLLPLRVCQSALAALAAGGGALAALLAPRKRLASPRWVGGEAYGGADSRLSLAMARVHASLGGGEGSAGAAGARAPSWLPPFGRAQAYDLLKGAILLLATLLLGVVQVSRVYHYIRGEAVIKLYVVYNVLSMADALLTSLGQDIMDGLYRMVRDMPLGGGGGGGGGGGSGGGGRAGGGAGGAAAAGGGAAGGGAGGAAAAGGAPAPCPSPHAGPTALAGAAMLAAQAAAAVAYVSLHAAIILVQIVCLNVAMNSRNNALLTLLVSNNFVELKGSVFKRYEPENLFQVACADGVERFTLSLYLVLIGLTELGSLPALVALLPSIAGIWACELGVDYAKHSFVAKFNRLHADLYGSFAAIIAHDALAVRGRYATSLDPTHAPVRRLGLPALPLSCVVVRMAIAKLPPGWLPRLRSPSGLLAWALGAALLLALKITLNMLLLVHAARVVEAQKGRLGRAAAAAEAAVASATAEVVAAAEAAAAAAAAAAAGEGRGEAQGGGARGGEAAGSSTPASMRQAARSCSTPRSRAGDEAEAVAGAFRRAGGGAGSAMGSLQEEGAEGAAVLRNSGRAPEEWADSAEMPSSPAGGPSSRLSGVPRGEGARSFGSRRGSVEGGAPPLRTPIPPPILVAQAAGGMDALALSQQQQDMLEALQEAVEDADRAAAVLERVSRTDRYTMVSGRGVGIPF